MKDMHNYPGPGMFPVMPDRVSVLGEFGGLGLPLKGHLWKDTDNWGYRTFKTTEELRENYHRLMLRLHPLIGKGLSAAVYTQTTDVEVEVNGLMTYDREVIKLDAAETAKWHKALFGPPPTVSRVRAETSEKTAQKWRYTTDKPADGWEKPDFDAAKWKKGDGGFGTKGRPGASSAPSGRRPTSGSAATVRAEGGADRRGACSACTTTRTRRSTSTACWRRRWPGYTTDYDVGAAHAPTGGRRSRWART